MLGGRADAMNLVVDPDPARRAYIAGTYNAHPHATAAAIATLEKLRQSEGAIYDQLEATTKRLTTGLDQIFAERGITATVSRNASAFVAYFADHQPVDWHDLNASHDWESDRAYRRALIAKGIYHFPVAVKQGSVSAAHTTEDIDRTLEMTREVLREIGR